MDWDKVKSDGYKQVDGSKHDLSHLQDPLCQDTCRLPELG